MAMPTAAIQASLTTARNPAPSALPTVEPCTRGPYAGPPAAARRLNGSCA
jgi:hypothetical protein